MSYVDLQEEVGAWFQANGEDKSCLLPQNLSSGLLKKLSNQAEQIIMNKDAESTPDLWQPFIGIVGMMMMNDEKTFTASREDLGMKARSYAVNTTIESLRRAQVLDFSKEFQLDDVLEINFERDFALSETGKAAMDQLNQKDQTPN